ALSLAATWVWTSPRPAVGMVTAFLLLIGVGVGVFSSPTLRERFESSWTPEGSGDRAALWRTGLRAVAAHPVVGLGLGRFHPSDFSPPGLRVHDAAEAVKAHDQYLTVAAETGLPGAALFVLFLLWVAFRLSSGTAPGASGLGALLFFALLSIAHDP